MTKGKREEPSPSAGAAGAPRQDPKPAQPAVTRANEALLQTLPFDDQRDFEDAGRGFIGTLPDARVERADGRVVWSLREYGFLREQRAPESVNPSLWRQARLNCRHGLFRVTEGMYQVRGFDLSNVTLVEGETGLIVIDPLISTEAAAAAMDLYFRHRPRRPVVAVVYTHSHVDHWGGVKGVVNEEEVETGRVSILAPAGFLEHAVSENVIAGSVMQRRAHYQFGQLLPKGQRGQVDAGLGKCVSLGTVGLIPPSDVIRKPRERRTLDGVEILFRLAPSSEAPAEFHMYFPRFKALNMAENVSHTLHNLLPFRGAEVRDALAWSKYIGEALEEFGTGADVLVTQHHWPTWGQDRVRAVLAAQRDLYKFIHDQTVRLMNHGYVPAEIAEALELPPTLAREWHARGYYGTVSHNAKAVYQKYLGWYDANPVNLNPLPPTEAARKLVEYMGGAEAILRRAREDFERGEYRWVAQVANQLVFADPDNREARELCADALEQLGYLAEAATWRNAYLAGAFELRNGPPRLPGQPGVNPGTLGALTLDMFFDLLGVRLNGPEAEGKKIRVNWTFTDTGQKYVLNLENSALTYVRRKHARDADVSLRLTRPTLDAIALRRKTFPEALQAGEIEFEGDLAKLAELFGLLDTFNRDFEIVEPKAAERGEP